MKRANRPSLDWLPLPFDLDQAPALGVLVLVAAALDVARMALMPEHPRLGRPRAPALGAALGWARSRSRPSGSPTACTRP
jgi:hypothetical protein